MSGKRSPRHSSLYTPSCSSLDSLWIDLNSFSFDTICHTGLILLIFGCFYFFLKLFFVKFILNFNYEHVQNHSCHSSTSAFCSHGENYIRWVVYVTLNNGKPTSRSCPRATGNSCNYADYHAAINFCCNPMHRWGFAPKSCPHAGAFTSYFLPGGTCQGRYGHLPINNLCHF